MSSPSCACLVSMSWHDLLICLYAPPVVHLWCDSFCVTLLCAITRSSVLCLIHLRYDPVMQCALAWRGVGLGVGVGVGVCLSYLSIYMHMNTHMYQVISSVSKHVYNLKLPLPIILETTRRMPWGLKALRRDNLACLQKGKRASLLYQCILQKIKKRHIWCQ